ncbi:MAG: hypothetical protein ACLTYN_09080 [Dysosmobacter welbionis]
MRLTRLAPLAERPPDSAVKLEDSLPSVFLLAVLCNVFITSPWRFRKAIWRDQEIPLPLSASWGSSSASLSTVSPICCFTAGLWACDRYLLVMALGNSAGGIWIPLAQAF